MAHVNIFCIMNSIIVEHTVLKGTTNDPGCRSRLDEETSSVKYVDLIVVCPVQFMIRHPSPVVLHVQRRRAGNVTKEERCSAGWIRDRYPDGW
jgi:hypothetical protein